MTTMKKKKKKVNKKLQVQQAMTASQRKQKRIENEPDYVDEADVLTDGQIAEKKKTRNRILLIAVPVILAIIIIVSVVIPVWFYSDYRYAKNPVVVMNLSNGMTLKYEVYAADAPNLATNFLFLCRIGYFDGNIIFDTQQLLVRFGGYYIEDGKYAHRKDDNALISATSKYFKDNANKETQFKYKVNRDSAVKFDINSTSAVYGLFGNYNTYCSEYSVLGRVGAKNSEIPYNLQYLASAFDTDTEENIEAILGLKQSDDYYRSKFKTPDDPFITIKSVRVHNYQQPFDNNFETYMTDSGAINSSWTDKYL